MPGKELVVAYEPTLIFGEQSESHKHLEVESPHKNVYVACDAFKAMRRQLQDYVHCLRHEVKTHHLNLLSFVALPEGTRAIDGRD